MSIYFKNDEKQLAIGRLKNLAPEDQELLKGIISILHANFLEFASEVEFDVARALEHAPEYRWDHRLAVATWRLFRLLEETLKGRHEAVIAAKVILSRQVIHMREAFANLKGTLDNWLEQTKDVT